MSLDGHGVNQLLRRLVMKCLTCAWLFVVLNWSCKPPRKAPDSEAWILLTIFAWVWEFLTLPLELSQAQAAQDSEQSGRSLFSDWAAGLVEQQNFFAGVGETSNLGISGDSVGLYHIVPFF